MNYLSIFKLKIIRKTTEDEENELFEELGDDLKLAVEEVLSRRGFEVLGSEMTSHPISGLNYGQCAHCATWTVNRDMEADREGIDEEIRDGGEHDSKLLCCNCLPKGHKWNWKSI